MEGSIPTMAASDSNYQSVLQSLLSVVSDTTGQRADPQDSLLALGVDSFASVLFAKKIQEKFGVKVRGADFAKYSTIEKLATHIAHPDGIVPDSGEDEGNSSSLSENMEAFSGLRGLMIFLVIAEHAEAKWLPFARPYTMEVFFLLIGVMAYIQNSSKDPFPTSSFLWSTVCKYMMLYWMLLIMNTFFSALGDLVKDEYPWRYLGFPGGTLCGQPLQFRLEGIANLCTGNTYPYRDLLLTIFGMQSWDCYQVQKLHIHTWFVSTAINILLALPFLVPMVKKLTSLSATLLALLGFIVLHISCVVAVDRLQPSADRWFALRFPLLKLPLVMTGVILGHLIMQDHLKVTPFPEWTRPDCLPKWIKCMAGDVSCSIFLIGSYCGKKSYSWMGDGLFLPLQMIGLCGWLFCLTHSPGITGTILRVQPLLFVGSVVYPVYLFHINFFLVVFSEQNFDVGASFLWLAMGFCLCVCIAYLIQEFLFTPLVLKRVMPWGQSAINKYITQLSLPRCQLCKTKLLDKYLSMLLSCWLPSQEAATDQEKGRLLSQPKDKPEDQLEDMLQVA